MNLPTPVAEDLENPDRRAGGRLSLGAVRAQSAQVTTAGQPVPPPPYRQSLLGSDQRAGLGSPLVAVLRQRICSRPGGFLSPGWERSQGQCLHSPGQPCPTTAHTPQRHLQEPGHNQEPDGKREKTKHAGDLDSHGVEPAHSRSTLPGGFSETDRTLDTRGAVT